MKDYKEFIKKMRREINKKLRGRYNVWYNKLPVCNGQEYEIVEIEISGTDTRAIYRFSELYKLYLETGSVHECMAILIDSVEKDVQKKVEIAKLEQILQYWDNVKEYVYPVLCKTEWNEERLKELPHREIMDLSISYFIPLTEFGRNGATLNVNKQMLKLWGIDEKALYLSSLRNLKEKPGQIVNITSIFGAKMLLKERLPLYFISNKDHVYGSGTILNIEQIQRFADELGANLYLIPFTIHEFIIFPDIEGIVQKNLDVMIQEIGKLISYREERLSDHGYYFNKNTSTFEICGSLED